MTCANCGHDRAGRGCGCIPAAFWQRTEVREAVARSDVTQIVRLLRVHTGLTQEAIANMAGLSQGMVSQMESGKRSLRNQTKKRHALEGLGAPKATEPLSIESLLDEAGMNTDDRNRLGYALKHPSRVDRASVTAFTQVLAAQRHLEDVMGPSTVLPGLAPQTDTVIRLLREARGPHRNAFAAVAAEWVQFTGWLHAALRRDRTAVALFCQAEEMADDAGEPTLAANAVSFRGYVARQQGRHHAVIRAAQAALHTPGIHPAQRTFDTLQAAQGHAALGDADTARRLLDKAVGLVGTAAAAGDPPPFTYWYRPAFFQMNIGFVHLELGDHATAADLLATGLDGLPADQRHADWTTEYRDALRAARSGIPATEVRGKDKG